VQRKVVIEEFKQRYLNQPYGDVWLKLRPLSYKVHPYQWATIGKEVSHIENATMDDVKGFFFRHYLPSNAILVVAGNVTVDQVRKLSEKWFGPIPTGNPVKRHLPAEPKQKSKRTQTVEAKVPASAIYKSYHMPGRFDVDFYPADLFSDVISRGHSSRLYQQLVDEKEIFTSISSFTTGTIDPGQLVISGRLKNGVGFEQTEAEVDRVVKEVLQSGPTQEELEKVKNQAEATLEFGEVELMSRATNLAFAALSGDATLVNREAEMIRDVTHDDILRVGKEIIKDENSSVLYYKSA
jgi:zinc protease